MKMQDRIEIEQYFRSRATTSSFLRRNATAYGNEATSRQGYRQQTRFLRSHHAASTTYRAAFPTGPLLPDGSDARADALRAATPYHFGFGRGLSHPAHPQPEALPACQLSH
jgi:hypothetical protein